MNWDQNISKNNSLNDLSLWEWNDINVSNFFPIDNVKIESDLLKVNTLDLIKKNKKQTLQLSLFPKIKFLKLSTPFNSEIKKTKKNTDLILNDFIPKVDKHTYIFDEEKEVYESPKVYFDVIPFTPSKWSIFLPLVRRLPYFFWTVWIIFILFLWYGIFVKSYIQNTLEKVAQIDFHNISHIEKNISDIHTRLTRSNFLFTPLIWINYFIGNTSIENASYIIKWWRSLTRFWLKMFHIYHWVEKVVKDKWINQIMFSQLLENMIPLFSEMKYDLNQWEIYFSKVWDLHDWELNTKFQTYYNYLLELQQWFNYFEQNFSTLQNILWHERKRVYGIILQNHDEIRPTGWFMGSILFVEIFRWKVQSFEFKDIYELEWRLKDFGTKNGVAFDEPAPEWLDRITHTFWLRDANYFPLISVSSDQIKYFLDKWWYPIDGVIYINQNVIMDLLWVTGPIAFDQIWTSIDSTNFSTIFSLLTESKVAKDHTLSTPKQYLFDFWEVLFAHLTQYKNYQSLLWVLLKSFEKKDISFYFFAEEENILLSYFGLSSAPTYTSYLDFNFPVFTSISWNKSDRYMQRSYQKDVSLWENCEINTSFTITQNNTYWLNDEIYMKNFLYNIDALWQVDIDELLAVQWKTPNKQFIRVLIPLTAEITSSTARYQVSLDHQWKEIWFYLTTNPLSQSSFWFSYSLQNPECQPYEYILEKQPGLKSYDLDFIKDWNLLQSQYTDTNFIYK